MEISKPRLLHLHTLDSLGADLVFGQAVGVRKDDAPFTRNSHVARNRIGTCATRPLG